ncbi:hypothetical protein [Laspinema olomoucense]|uniref:hypothetical protein n=1 Tax=Laspinema olomoucense TaxID=3231600 RepID=UPI0021BAFCE5|nr:hypothetical protein [Laspinema sp. D3d]MCT7973834.1 hypothetical protein [Laspinema sp. D3d]
MRLYTICPNPDNFKNYTPEERIALGIVKNVPCLNAGGYAWQYDALKKNGIDPNLHILPVRLTESKKIEIKEKLKNEEMYEPIYIYNGNLEMSSNSSFFVEEQDLPVITDKEILVSLKLPLSAAQPYYEFVGKIEVILGIYADYYGKECKIEKENMLCSGIIKMTEGSQLSFHYTNRYGQGVAITGMMKETFQFICHDGKLTRLDNHKFANLYSDFEL